MTRIRRFCLLALIVIGSALLLAGSAEAMPSPNPEEDPFAITPGSFHFTTSSDQAAAHANWVTTFDFEHNSQGRTYNDVRETVVNFPPGFNASNTAVPTCTTGELIEGEGIGGQLSRCPVGSQIGKVSLDVSATAGQPAEVTVPLYNMEVTSFGVTAQLGFKTSILTQILDVSVRPGDSGLTVTAPAIAKVGEAHALSVTVWGIPAAHEHDAERGEVCGAFDEHPPVCRNEFGEPKAAGIAERPLLSNPTSCRSFTATMKADSWEEPDNWSSAASEVGPIGECERVPFIPFLEAKPTTNAAESPSGLEASINVPQAWDNPFSISTSNLKDAVVTLPEGITLNPSAGSGLGYCTEAQLAEMTALSGPGVGCPPESKLGGIEIETPVLVERATPQSSSVYVAKPFDNPFHSLLALYLVARIPSRGIIVTAAGEVHPDPVTGRLTTTFRDNPQVPFNRFTLRFNQGATSPLVTPPTCGAFAVTGALTAWARPLEPVSVSATPFAIEHGVGGGPCPSGGLPPFHPLLHAGSYSNQAGAYSPFYIRLSRQDGEQEITHFSIKLPPGLLGKLAGVAKCTDAQVAAAKARTGPHGGQEEEESPSCPASSQIGRTEVEAGVGTVLASAPGKIYLAGPYHGAPISVAAITAARVGPFDLGTVVVREALKIHPETGEVSVDATGSDPLPHIIAGIPTHLRNIRIYMDRPEFVLNPTSCERTSTASTVLGSGKDFVSEADDNPITVSSFFQAANCAALGFKPKLRFSLKGGTKRAQVPAFKAVVTARKGDANIAHAEVVLPTSEQLEQSNIGLPCTRVQFAEGGGNGERCPKGSILGRARAVTPILSEPLEGPVIFRSNGGERKVPDIVAALHGQEINIDLVGWIDSVLTHNKQGEVTSGRIRNRFMVVPDAPVEKFTLELFGGKRGLLVNTTNLCLGKHEAEVKFTAHNGKVDSFKTPLTARCGKKGKGRKKRQH